MLLALFSLVVGVASGFAGGGRFANVGWRRIRLVWLPLAWACGLVLSVFLRGGPAFLLGLAGMVCLAAFAVVNTKVLSCMWLLALGLCLNVVVTADNHGMPYSPISLATAGVRPKEYNDVPESTALSHPEREGDQLLFLSDIIPIAPLHTVVSFGDLLVAFGLGAVTATGMWDRRPRRFRAPKHLKQTVSFDLFGRGPVGLVEPRAVIAVKPATSVATAVDSTGSEPHVPGISARLLLLEATGDPSVLIDLSGGASADLAGVTASHVVGEALRRHALNDGLVARAVEAVEAVDNGSEDNS